MPFRTPPYLTLVRLLLGAVIGGAAMVSLQSPPAMAQPDQPDQEQAGQQTTTQPPAKRPAYVDGQDITMRGPDFFRQFVTPENPEAAFFTGYAYIMRGFPDKAFRWIRQAANSETDIVDSWYFMGYLYSAGLTPEGRDMTQAETWFEKASRTGHIDAANQLYFVRLLGPEGTPDPAGAFLLVELLANRGDPVATNNLGLMYEFGIGTAPDIDKAVQLFKDAAAAGNPSAHFNLGRLFEHGKGVEKNIGSAAQEYLIAADLSYAPAQYRVGQMMRDGVSFTQNYFNALEWFAKAAEQYYPDAMYEAGRMYEEGKGARMNIQRAGNYYEEALKVGHIPSIMKLGHLKEIGVPTTEDLRQAYSWYQLAYLLAKDNDTKNMAMDAREKVAGALSDDQRRSARRQAEIRSENLLELQDKFAELAEGATIHMFANPATPRRFPADMVRRALKVAGLPDTKN